MYANLIYGLVYDIYLILLMILMRCLPINRILYILIYLHTLCISFLISIKHPQYIISYHIVYHYHYFLLNINVYDTLQHYTIFINTKKIKMKKLLLYPILFNFKIIVQT
jgi:hypothetical protein